MPKDNPFTENPFGAQSNGDPFAVRAVCYSAPVSSQAAVSWASVTAASPVLTRPGARVQAQAASAPQPQSEPWLHARVRVHARTPAACCLVQSTRADHIPHTRLGAGNGWGGGGAWGANNGSAYNAASTSSGGAFSVPPATSEVCPPETVGLPLGPAVGQQQASTGLWLHPGYVST